VDAWERRRKLTVRHSDRTLRQSSHLHRDGDNCSANVSPAVVATTVESAASTTAGPPVAMSIYAGDGQNASAFSPTIVPPAVRVTDAAGVGVPGVVVTFSVRSGGGSVTGANATTNSQGVATLGQWILGPVGGQSLFATGTGLSGSPLLFAAMATGAVRIVTFGDSNTDAGWSGTNSYIVATSYVSSSGPYAGPNSNDPTQLAGKLEAKWRAQSSVSFTAVNHGIAGTGTGAGRTTTGAPNAREYVDGVSRFAGEVLGAGYPWSGGETSSYFPNGPVRRVAAFVPGPNDFVYVSLGTNDSFAGWDATQTAANINWMIDQWVAAGHQPDHFILTTLAPRAGREPQSFWPIPRSARLSLREACSWWTLLSEPLTTTVTRGEARTTTSAISCTTVRPFAIGSRLRSSPTC
jgi:Bacterial Ig-like domain (group 1).